MKLRGSLLVVAAVLLSTTVSYGCPVSEPKTVLDSHFNEALTLIATHVAAPLSLNATDTQVDADATSQLVLLDHEGDGMSVSDGASQLVLLDQEDDRMSVSDAASLLVLLDHEGDGMSVSDAEELAITLAELRTSWDFAGMADRSLASEDDAVPQRRFLVSDEDEETFASSREVIDVAAEVTGSHATLDIDVELALDGYEDR